MFIGRGRIVRALRVMILGALTALTAVLLALLVRDGYRWITQPSLASQMRSHEKVDYRPSFNWSRDPRYDVHICVNHGQLRIVRLTKYCLKCGELPPQHTESCPVGALERTGAVLDYVWYAKRLESREVPGLKWYRGIVIASECTELSISLWLLIIVCGAYPLLAFVRGPVRRYRRRRRGLCLSCGYNLTGNVSGICPECGHAIAEPQAAR